MVTDTEKQQVTIDIKGQTSKFDNFIYKTIKPPKFATQ